MTRDQWIASARTLLARWRYFGANLPTTQRPDYALKTTTGDLLATRLLIDPPRPPVEITYIDFVFDGPPSPDGPRFIEAEDAGGRSIRVGEWSERPDGLWALRIPITSGFPAQRPPAASPNGL